MQLADHLIDEECRRMIVTNFDNTIFVEAGAGSGKTTMMVARILALIIQKNIDISQIAAITFTREGAASLKSKIRKELEKARKSDEYHLPGGEALKIDDCIRETLTKSIELLPLAEFSTIHSFSLSMLKERPVEVCIDPAFEMNMEENDTECFDQVWTKYILSEPLQNSNYIKFIIDNNVDLDELKRITRIKSSNPDLDLYIEDTKDVTEEEINNAFSNCISSAAVLQAEMGVLKNDVSTAAGRTRFNFASRTIESFQTSRTLIEKKNILLRFKTTSSLKWTNKQEHLKAAVESIGSDCDIIRKRHYDYILFRLSGFIKEFEEYFTEYKKKNSLLQFNDLLFLIRNLLKENDEVRKYFKRRFKYIFVDETQDTDPLQTEIMFYLCEKYECFERDWKKVQLSPGKLFMVGDPKQSIYKFRRADIQIYSEAKKIIKDQGGMILQLSKNFRSSAKIIDLVNTHFNISFSGLSKQIEDNLHPEYKALEAAAEQKTVLPAHIYSLTHTKHGNSRDYDAYLRKMVFYIKTLCHDGKNLIYDKNINSHRAIRYNDIMILFHKMTNLEKYTQRFEKEGIPFVEVGSKTFFKTNEVRSLILALKAIDDSSDTVSLFGALVSPLFGISEKEIFDFIKSEYGLKFNLFAHTDDEGSKINQALEYMRGLFYEKSSMLPSDVVKKLFDMTGICHLSLFESNGMQNTAKYYRVLELVMDIESDQSLSFHSVISRLDEIMDSSDPKLANISLNEHGDNAIRLMTIHKAKGLEAPVVIIADENDSEKDPVVIYLRDEGKMIIPYLNLGGYFQNKNSKELLELENQKCRCEKERLRYVAATRAMNMLVFCYPEDSKDNRTFVADFKTTVSRIGDVEDIKDLKYVDNEEPVEGEILDVGAILEKSKDMMEENIQKFTKAIDNTEPVFVSIHSLMEYSKDTFRKVHGKSRGKEFGIIVHKMMENYVGSDCFSLLAVLDNWIEEIGVAKKFKQDVIDTFERLKQNKFVIEAKAAKEKYCEWEFFIKDKNSKDKEQIVNGVIDVVYKNISGNWTILDYKTDDVSDSERKNELNKIYSEQLNLYKKYFKELTSKDVSETQIIYTEEA